MARSGYVSPLKCHFRKFLMTSEFSLAREVGDHLKCGVKSCEFPADEPSVGLEARPQEHSVFFR